MTPTEINIAFMKKGLTMRKAVAEPLKVTPQAVSNCVHRSSKSPEIRQKIAEVLEKPVEEVFPEIEREEGALSKGVVCPDGEEGRKVA